MKKLFTSVKTDLDNATTSATGAIKSLATGLALLLVTAISGIALTKDMSSIALLTINIIATGLLIFYVAGDSAKKFLIHLLLSLLIILAAGISLYVIVYPTLEGVLSGVDLLKGIIEYLVKYL
ncbi:MAG: hypothetical protein ACRCXZ_03210 [Patescibacteria group bacterium]